jgi:hypothetical protein
MKFVRIALRMLWLARSRRPALRRQPRIDLAPF